MTLTKIFMSIILFLLFFSSGMAQSQPQVTPNPYDETKRVIGYSGVYELLIDSRFWKTDQITPKNELIDWLDKIASNGGNVIRFFAYANWGDTVHYDYIRPWKKVSGRYVLYPRPATPNENVWNGLYWTRLSNLMIELQSRELTAWIDIWDYCSIKGGRYSTHPFYGPNNWNWDFNIDPTNPWTFSVVPANSGCFKPIIKKARQWFEEKLVESTRQYSPIYSTNELSLWNTKNFLIDLTDYLIHQLEVPEENISHSSSLNDEAMGEIKEKYENKLLWAVHHRSTPFEIQAGYQPFIDRGIKIISSDGETDGDEPGYTHWKDKHPLSPDQAYESMKKTLNFGFKGMEILDRDEYSISYENPDLTLLDELTLQRLVEAYEEWRIIITSPNGGENWKYGYDNNITWDAQDITRDLKITLWKDGQYVGLLGNEVNPDLGSYSWTTGHYYQGTADGGTGYQIKIKVIGEDRSDFSNGTFKIKNTKGITSPNGGEIWQIGSAKNITWLKDIGISGNLEITLWKDGIQMGVIVDTNINVGLGEYLWTVGSHNGGTASAGPGYRIKIKLINTNKFDFSNSPFTLID